MGEEKRALVSLNLLLPANQRSGTLGAQPVRFSARHPNFPMQLCITAAGAAALFKGRVCMSSNPVDANFSEGKTPQVAQNRSAAQLHFNAPFSKAKITTSQQYPFSTFITDAAANIRMGSSCENEPFRAFKLATTGHISIALWDVKSNSLEIFDPYGDDLRYVPFQESLVRTLFSKYPGPKPDRVTFVNKTNLQAQDPSDIYCQTWIYWYLYERTVNGKSAKETLQTAYKLHPLQRTDMIRSFWHFINQNPTHKK